LDSYAPHHLTLFQSDGTSQIDPETPDTDLKEIPWKPMVVTVEELPIPANIKSSKKQLTYKGMSTEASCRKYLDAIANEIFVITILTKLTRNLQWVTYLRRKTDNFANRVYQQN
jgi:hypothetical protein